MTIEEYKNKVIELFKGDKVTDEQWEEMALAVLYASERDSNILVAMIDAVICPNLEPDTTESVE